MLVGLSDRGQDYAERVHHNQYKALRHVKLLSIGAVSIQEFYRLAQSGPQSSSFRDTSSSPKLKVSETKEYHIEGSSISTTLMTDGHDMSWRLLLFQSSGSFVVGTFRYLCRQRSSWMTCAAEWSGSVVMISHSPLKTPTIANIVPHPGASRHR